MIAQQAPAALPVTLDEVKAYLRLTSEAEDALLAGLIRAATAHCERFTGLALLARDAVETVPACADWRRLSLTPVRAITLVEGLPADGAAFALPLDAYAIDIDADGDGWVRVTRPGAAGRALVHFSAGLADDRNAVPEGLRQGIIRLVAHLFAHRDAADEAGPPTAVAALWRPWRRMRLA